MCACVDRRSSGRLGARRSVVVVVERTTTAASTTSRVRMRRTATGSRWTVSRREGVVAAVRVVSWVDPVNLTTCTRTVRTCPRARRRTRAVAAASDAHPPLQVWYAGYRTARGLGCRKSRGIPEPRRDGSRKVMSRGSRGSGNRCRGTPWRW